MSSVYQFKAGPYSSHTILLAALPDRGGGRKALDLGCADGYVSALLASRGYEVTGVERQGGVTGPFPPEVLLIESDLNDPLPDIGAAFSDVICADVLEHLRDPVALLKQLPPLLAPGGRLIASLPNSGNLYFRLRTIGGTIPKEDRGLFDRTHLHFFTWPQWVDLFRRSGFEIEAVRPTGIPVGLAFPRLDGTLPVRIAERLCYDLGRFWMTLFSYQFVVIARPEKTA